MKIVYNNWENEDAGDYTFDTIKHTIQACNVGYHLIKSTKGWSIILDSEDGVRSEVMQAIAMQLKAMRKYPYMDGKIDKLLTYHIEEDSS